MRLLVLIVTGMIGGAIGWPGAIVFFGLPAMAALLISEHGRDRYLAEDAPRIVRLLGWLLAFYAYLGLLTDRFPTGGERLAVRLEVAPAGAPTVRSAVLRILASIPYALVLFVLGLCGFFAWIVAMIGVLSSGRYPRSIYDFLTSVLRYHARFLCYHASLVDHLPHLDEAPAADEASPRVV
ncbi:MAG TPA: DUF4389 domain-containing protein [Kofleriaceae bacterium]|nr:DUF4389 domain-containing protein [Kofleriaceae bacterium]